MTAESWPCTGRRGGEVGGSDVALGGYLNPRGRLENIGRFLRKPGKNSGGNRNDEALKCQGKRRTETAVRLQAHQFGRREER
jgi:hypothetical protein